MKKILNFSNFVNENYDVNEDGYGQLPFFFSKNGDVFNYFFKTEGDKARGFVISIGKFSKFATPSEAKQDYAVLSITELTVEAVDQAVVDKGVYEQNNNSIELDERELNRVLDVMSKCVVDYLEKNPKVSKFYDEMQGTVKSTQYTSKMGSFLDKWPGGQGAWKMQEVEAGKLNYIVK